MTDHIGRGLPTPRQPGDRSAGNGISRPAGRAPRRASQPAQRRQIGPSAFRAAAAVRHSRTRAPRPTTAPQTARRSGVVRRATCQRVGRPRGG